MEETNDYRTWRQLSASVNGRQVVVATKPGVFAHGRTDPASQILAERVVIANGDVVVNMSCGNGLFGAAVAASGVASRLLLTDRNIVSFEAARRTLAANDARNAEAFIGHGAQLLPAGTRADVVAIRIPVERLALLQLLVDAFRILRVGGTCYFAGATNEGIKTAMKTAERIFGNAGVLARDSSHRLIIASKTTESPVDSSELDSPYLDSETFRELDVTLRAHQFILYSRPGVFSWDHADEATMILADAMHIGDGESILDLGCGSGGLGVVAGTLASGVRVCMVDADSEAIRSASRSAATAGLRDFRALASDVAATVADERFDVVVTNPPFHVGKATDLNVPLQFIQESWQVLKPGGRLYLVANRTLPYEQAIRHRFGNISTLHDGSRFKVLAATR